MATAAPVAASGRRLISPWPVGMVSRKTKSSATTATSQTATAATAVAGSSPSSSAILPPSAGMGTSCLPRSVTILIVAIWTAVPHTASSNGELAVTGSSSGRWAKSVNLRSIVHLFHMAAMRNVTCSSGIAGMASWILARNVTVASSMPILQTVSAAEIAPSRVSGMVSGIKSKNVTMAICSMAMVVPSSAAEKIPWLPPTLRCHPPLPHNQLLPARIPRVPRFSPPFVSSSHGAERSALLHKVLQVRPALRLSLSWLPVRLLGLPS